MLFACQNIELVQWDSSLFAMRESRSESVCISNEWWTLFWQSSKKMSVWAGYANVSKRCFPRVRILSWCNGILHFLQCGNRVLKVFVFQMDGEYFLAKWKIWAFGFDIQTFLSDAFRMSGYWVGGMGFFTFCNAEITFWKCLYSQWMVNTFLAKCKKEKRLGLIYKRF